MIKTIIGTAFLLISTLGFSQITLNTKLVIGKDTIFLKPGQSIPKVLDSLNTVRLMAYQAEQQRVEDSIYMAQEARIRKGPHLYYNTKDEKSGIYYINAEFDFEEGKKILDTMDLAKVDSVITYSNMAYEVLNEINTRREQRLETDSLMQQMFSEDVIAIHYLKKDGAILEKNIHEKCPEECYKEVYGRIAKKKRLLKELLSEDLEYAKVAIVEDKRNVAAFVEYKKKNSKNYYTKIVYIR